MPALTFPPEDLDSIRHDRFRHPHPRVPSRMEVLWLKGRGLPHAEIADLAGTSVRSVQRVLVDYRRGGAGRVRALGWRGKPNELAPTSRHIPWNTRRAPSRRPRRPSSGSPASNAA